MVISEGINEANWRFSRTYAKLAFPVVLRQCVGLYNIEVYKILSYKITDNNAFYMDVGMMIQLLKKNSYLYILISS
jgi:hypothetical protein